MHFFPNFYSGLTLWCRRCPFVLAPGAIDGAPNVSALRAIRTAVFVTDQLNQNIDIHEEIVRLTDSPQQMVEKSARILLGHWWLYKLYKGHEAFARVNSFDVRSCSYQTCRKQSIIINESQYENRLRFHFRAFKILSKTIFIERQLVSGLVLAFHYRTLLQSLKKQRKARITKVRLHYVLKSWITFV